MFEHIHYLYCKIDWYVPVGILCITNVDNNIGLFQIPIKIYSAQQFLNLFARAVTGLQKYVPSHSCISVAAQYVFAPGQAIKLSPYFPNRKLHYYFSIIHANCCYVFCSIRKRRCALTHNVTTDYYLYWHLDISSDKAMINKCYHQLVYILLEQLLCIWLYNK